MNKRPHSIDLSHLSTSRRQFLGGSAAAIAAGTIGLGFSPRAKAGGGVSTLIYLFLRGGMDGLSFIVPTGEPHYGHYHDARDRTRIRFDDPNPALRPLFLDNSFGMNPLCPGLHDLYQDGRLAIVQAAGHPSGTYTRSHFDAQEQIELGTPGAQASIDGWLTRHLQTSPNIPTDAVFTALATSYSPPISLAGRTDVATISTASSFHPDPNGTYASTHVDMLRALYDGGGGLDLAATAAVDAVELIGALTLGTYVPGGSVVYPNTSLARSLSLIAQLMKQDIGISVATLDYGGWDTHSNQNPLNGFSGFGQRIRELSEAVTAFYRDIEASGRDNDVAIVVQSEFGRQVGENLSFGTDHGLGAPMMVLGGGVNNRVGGTGAPQLFGSFPGIARAQRDSDSLVPTTDFRRVLATVTDRLLGNSAVDQIFPGYTSYVPLGFA